MTTKDLIIGELYVTHNAGNKDIVLYLGVANKSISFYTHRFISLIDNRLEYCDSSLLYLYKRF